ncbi:hypothetical protein [Burkholderia cenocepacia]|uniref:hypothetical protein n=1 Tax=Burkholderia cenocepacia TaxID=95486 RepID=UPI00264CB05A|nr:hypothetical protein [Burkholderia cenocepacia]MDN7457829.1 hypothetical protein [Burkholderia cenocepacia]
MFQLILLLRAAAEICCRHHAGDQRAPPSAGALSDSLLAGVLWQNTLGVTRPLSREPWPLPAPASLPIVHCDTKLVEIAQRVTTLVDSAMPIDTTLVETGFGLSALRDKGLLEIAHSTMAVTTLVV